MPDRQETPSEVRIRSRPREPVTDPTLGIDVPREDPRRPAKHRLVTIGDSLTEGFMSAAVYRTDLSWPAIAAYELGLGAEQFRFPTYEWPAGPGGLPLDLERFARSFERRFGARLDFWEIVAAGLWLQNYMDRVEDFWERGAGAGHTAGGLRSTTWRCTAGTCSTRSCSPQRSSPADSARPTGDEVLSQLVENHQDRAAWPVLQRARQGNRGRTVLEAATAMSKANEGIETLVVVLGSNNALGSVVYLEPVWTPEGYADLTPEERLAARVGCNVWRPSAFAADWEQLVANASAGSQPST